jgi:hypothetical protein
MSMNSGMNGEDLRSVRNADEQQSRTCGTPRIDDFHEQLRSPSLTVWEEEVLRRQCSRRCRRCRHFHHYRQIHRFRLNRHCHCRFPHRFRHFRFPGRFRHRRPNCRYHQCFRLRHRCLRPSRRTNHQSQYWSRRQSYGPSNR